jgi:hypothetical protein
MAAYRALDHVVIRLRAVEPLWSLLAGEFGLPVSWPLQHSAFASFGWINVGNTNLELWAARDDADMPPEAQPPRVQGLALDPADLEASIAELTARGIACKPPRAFRTQDASGASVTNFTNAVLLDLSSDACCVFFCAWDAAGTIYPWPEKLDAPQRRARDAEVFQASAGGPLGMIGLRRIGLAVPDQAEASVRWRALTASPRGPLALMPDIAVALAPGRHPFATIESLCFGVRSLPQARTFLAERQLLEASSPDELVLARHACAGLDLRFVEAPRGAGASD